MTKFNPNLALAARRRVPPIRPPASSLSNTPRKSCSGDPVEILLIEDDPGIQSLILALLENLAPGRFIVSCAMNGNDALRLLRRRDPAVIVLDLLLPEMNGFEILRHLKSEKCHLLERTIVVTAASDKTLADFSNNWKVRHLLRKPFDIFELATMIIGFESQQQKAQ